MKKLLSLSLLLGLNANAATSPDMVKGIDLTGLSSVTAAQLNQLVDNSYPATNRGMVIIQSTTPDHATYPKLTNYVWIDTSVIPYTLKVYTTNSWVAATIGANAIGNANIADAAVTSNKIANSTIVATNIASSAVVSDKIIDGAVTTAKIQAGAVTNAQLAADAVTTDKILDLTIATADIADSAITTAKLASDSVNTVNITNGAVTGAKIASNTITSNNVVNAGLTATNIAVGSSTNQYIRANDAGVMSYMSGGLGAYAYTNIQTAITNTTVLPLDDTIPTDSEGFLVATLVITPKSTNSMIEITFTGFACSSVNAYCAALYKGGSSAAIAAISCDNVAATSGSSFALKHTTTLGSVSPQTFTVRVGPASAGTVVFNGLTTGGQVFGGVAGSSFTIKEIFQ